MMFWESGIRQQRKYEVKWQRGRERERRALIAFRLDKRLGVTQLCNFGKTAAAASLLLFMTSLRHLCRPDQIFQSNIRMRNFHVSADANDATSLGSSNKKIPLFQTLTSNF